MTQATRADVHKALAQKANCLLRHEKVSEKQLRIIVRCLPEHWPFFMPVVYKLLEASDNEELPWTCDVSKQYMIKATKLVQGWRLIFQVAEGSGHGIEQVYGSICSTIMSAPLPARVEVDTVLLPGYKRGQTRGGVNAKGKGSASAGSMPMILGRGGVRT